MSIYYYLKFSTAMNLKESTAETIEQLEKEVGKVLLCYCKFFSIDFLISKMISVP